MSRGYGGNGFELWREDLRDRWHGNAARANARWGFLTPPPGRGRLIWVRAGGRREDALLGAEVLRALRDRRQDVRLALTFENEFADVLAPRLKGLKRVAVGFGPADAPSAVARVLKRFKPLGVVFARERARPRFAWVLAERKTRAIALNTRAVRFGRFDAAYPTTPEQWEEWRAAGTAAHVAEPADFLTLLTEAQVDPNFRTAVCGAAEFPLWWVHGIARADAPAWARAWDAMGPSSQGVLFVSGDALAAVRAAFAHHPQVWMSQWNRMPLAPGTLAIVDDARWWPAVAASSDAIHLAEPGAAALWQALAAGAPVSVARAALAPAAVAPDASSRLPVIAGPEAVCEDFAACVHDPVGARLRGDAARRLFWQARRRAAEANEDFLTRVYDW